MRRRARSTWFLGVNKAHLQYIQAQLAEMKDLWSKIEEATGCAPTEDQVQDLILTIKRAQEKVIFYCQLQI